MTSGATSIKEVAQWDVQFSGLNQARYALYGRWVDVYVYHVALTRGSGSFFKLERSPMIVTEKGAASQLMALFDLRPDWKDSMAWASNLYKETKEAK